MNADGSGLVRFGRPAKEDHGKWSPDGRRIAYQHEFQENTDVYVMNANGSGKLRLTDGAARDGWPDWSPDGARIVFASERDGHREIYVMKADGTEQTRLTSSDRDNLDPTSSPDGSRIAFNSERDGNSEIYVMQADGLRQTRLTQNAVSDERPDWFPDGQQILFSRYPEPTTAALWVMNSSGTNEKQLSLTGYVVLRAHWSPDGKRIACQFHRDVSKQEHHRRRRMRFAHIVAAAALVCTASGSPAATQTPAGTSDEAQIRQLMTKPQPEIPRTKDFIYWSGPLARPQIHPVDPATPAPAAVQQRVPGSFKQVTDVVRLEVAKSGDLAYEFSNFKAEYLLKDQPGKPVQFTGSILRVWKKESGGWKMAAQFQRPHEDNQKNERLTE